MINDNLQNTINFGQAKGSLAPTKKQLNTIRYMIYNYKLTIKDSKDMHSRQGVSAKIAEISKAIKSGKVKERVNRPTNCKVKVIQGFWKLVQEVEQRKDLNDQEFSANGFAKFVEEENERQAQKLRKQLEEKANA